MKRRVFVSVAGATVFGSGCLERYGLSEYDSETTPRETTQSPDEGETGLGRVGLSATTNVVRPATDESPATISIAVTNETETTQTYRFGGGRPISDFVGTRAGSDDKILLVPEDMDGISIVDRNDDDALEVIPEMRDGKCWTAIDRIISEELLQKVSLEPGESLSGQYRVLSYDGCASRGTYTFENDFLHGEKEISWSLGVTYPVQKR